MKEIRGQSHFNYNMKKYYLYSIRNEYVWKKYNVELIRPIKLRCFVFPFYQIFGITWAFTSSEASFLSQKSQLPLKHTPSNSFLFILLLYCHAYYSYKNHFRALNSDPLQVKNWPHLQRFDYSGFPLKAMNEIRPFIYVPLPRQARFWNPLSLCRG